MEVKATHIADVKIIQPAVYGDARGFFWKPLKNAVIRISCKPTLNLFRIIIPALHGTSYAAYISRKQSLKANWYAWCAEKSLMSPSISAQIRPPMVSGSVFCFQKRIKLSYGSHGLAHGFVVLSDMADFEYKCTQYYNPKDEACLMWNDPDVAIQWPVEQPILSVKINKDSRCRS